MQKEEDKRVQHEEDEVALDFVSDTDWVSPPPPPAGDEENTDPDQRAENSNSGSNDSSELHGGVYPLREGGLSELAEVEVEADMNELEESDEDDDDEEDIDEEDGDDDDEDAAAASVNYDDEEDDDSDENADLCDTEDGFLDIDENNEDGAAVVASSATVTAAAAAGVRQTQCAAAVDIVDMRSILGTVQFFDSLDEAKCIVCRERCAMAHNPVVFHPCGHTACLSCVKQRQLEEDDVNDNDDENENDKNALNDHQNIEHNTEDNNNNTEEEKNYSKKNNKNKKNEQEEKISDAPPLLQQCPCGATIEHCSVNVMLHNVYQHLSRRLRDHRKLLWGSSSSTDSSASSEALSKSAAGLSSSSAAFGGVNSGDSVTAFDSLYNSFCQNSFLSLAQDEHQGGEVELHDDDNSSLIHDDDDGMQRDARVEALLRCLRRNSHCHRKKAGDPPLPPPAVVKGICYETILEDGIAFSPAEVLYEKVVAKIAMFNDSLRCPGTVSSSDEGRKETSAARAPSVERTNDTATLPAEQPAALHSNGQPSGGSTKSARRSLVSAVKSSSNSSFGKPTQPEDADRKRLRGDGEESETETDEADVLGDTHRSTAEREDTVARVATDEGTANDGVHDLVNRTQAAVGAELQIFWDAENVSGKPYAQPTVLLMSILEQLVNDGVIESNAKHLTHVYFVDREVNSARALDERDKHQLRDAQCTLVQCTKRKEDADRQIAAAIRRQIDNKHDPASRPILIVSSDKDFNSILQDAKRSGLPTYVVHEAPPKSMHENLLKFYATTFSAKELVQKHYPDSFNHRAAEINTHGKLGLIRNKQVGHHPEPQPQRIPEKKSVSFTNNAPNNGSAAVANQIIKKQPKKLAKAEKKAARVAEAKAKRAAKAAAKQERRRANQAARQAKKDRKKARKDAVTARTVGKKMTTGSKVNTAVTAVPPPTHVIVNNVPRAIKYLVDNDGLRRLIREAHSDKYGALGKTAGGLWGSSVGKGVADGAYAAHADVAKSDKIYPRQVRVTEQLTPVSWWALDPTTRGYAAATHPKNARVRNYWWCEGCSNRQQCDHLHERYIKVWIPPLRKGAQGETLAVPVSFFHWNLALQDVLDKLDQSTSTSVDSASSGDSSAAAVIAPMPIVCAKFLNGECKDDTCRGLHPLILQITPDPKSLVQQSRRFSTEFIPNAGTRSAVHARTTLPECDCTHVASCNKLHLRLPEVKPVPPPFHQQQPSSLPFPHQHPPVPAVPFPPAASSWGAAPSAAAAVPTAPFATVFSSSHPHIRNPVLPSNNATLPSDKPRSPIEAALSAAPVLINTANSTTGTPPLPLSAVPPVYNFAPVATKTPLNPHQQHPQHQHHTQTLTQPHQTINSHSQLPHQPKQQQSSQQPQQSQSHAPQARVQAQQQPSSQQQQPSVGAVVLSAEEIDWAQEFIKFYGLDLAAVFTQEGYERLKTKHEELNRRGDSMNRERLRKAVRYLRSVPELAARFRVAPVPYVPSAA